jgi:2,4-dienoyl-CoA reductase-like NADH-dependent reductase (Old Yellow Enzyme family)
MSSLFKPLKLRSVEVKNRLAVSPMCEYSSKDGFANEWHLVHLGSRAVGGASLVIAEATAVSPEGRITHHDLGIWKDDHIDFLKRITAFIESNDAVPGIQLAHAGRKASHHRPWEGSTPLQVHEDAWQTFAPSSIAYKEGDPIPQALDTRGIKKVIDDFGQAAARSKEAGFKLIEIHGAHGYLLHEFLSPLSNHRTDAYGGSFDNRIRFVIEIIDAIREVWPLDLPLCVRISATDWLEGGWSIEDSIALVRILKQKDVDLIDCSTGGNTSKAKIPVGPLYQVPFAERIKKETGILTAAVGMITTAEQAEKIISDGSADLVVLARQLLRDPYFPLRAAKELNVDVRWPDQYLRAKNY